MRLSPVATIVALLTLASTARAELTANDLLLVCNGNSKQSIRAAEFYARTRNVPAGRILKLDLPGAEEVPFETYERNVVPPIRQFLRDAKLVSNVKCIVLFYGVPIRIAPPKLDDAARAEVATITAMLTAAGEQANTTVNQFESFVAAEVPDYTPEPPNTPDDFQATQARYNRAALALAPAIESADPEKKQRLTDRLLTVLSVLIGEEGIYSRFIEPNAARGPAGSGPTTQAAEQASAMKTRVAAAQARLAELGDRRYDPAARAASRDLIRQTHGLFNSIAFLKAQLGYFGADQAQASLDSELALLWVNNYNRNKWLDNGLYYRIPYSGPRLLMTSRIDGPDEGSAGLLLLSSMKAEREGLTGNAVVDSRGIQLAPGNGYAVYDETLRNLAAILKKTSLPLVFDEKDAVLPADSVKNVALYAGWYSVGNYVPSMKFAPGAVGFHIASFEMVTLRDPNAKGWVPNLIKNGIAATMGPVSEPYLHAFPNADEFFPLLLTGKLSLAECYWRTQRTMSWQMSLIGDPLYRPFAKNPQLKPEDLPVDLRKALQ